MTTNGRPSRPAVPSDVKIDVLLTGLCTYCGDPADTIDHDIPVSRGGTNDRNNLVPACWPCNARKHSLTGDEYRAQQEILARVPIDEMVLDDLVDCRTGDQSADLTAALIEVIRRYEVADELIKALMLQGGSIVRAMRVRGWSWHRIALATNVSQRTAGRWMKLAIEHQVEEGGAVSDRPQEP